MTAKQLVASKAPDGSQYITSTDGVGNLVPLTTSPTAGHKLMGSYAPDGSLYVTVTDGLDTLT
jgi:hypothetical protein